MLKRVLLNNFVQFKEEQKLDFEKGSHFFIGPNNSGKTSVFEAIRRCLSISKNTGLSSSYDPTKESVVICIYHGIQDNYDNTNDNADGNKERHNKPYDDENQNMHEKSKSETEEQPTPYDGLEMHEKSKSETEEQPTPCDGLEMHEKSKSETEEQPTPCDGLEMHEKSKSFGSQVADDIEKHAMSDDIQKKKVEGKLLTSIICLPKQTSSDDPSVYVKIVIYYNGQNRCQVAMDFVKESRNKILVTERIDFLNTSGDAPFKAMLEIEETDKFRKIVKNVLYKTKEFDEKRRTFANKDIIGDPNTPCNMLLRKHLDKHVVLTFAMRSIGPLQWSRSKRLDVEYKNENYRGAQKRSEIISWYIKNEKMNQSVRNKEQLYFDRITNNSGFEFGKDDNCMLKVFKRSDKNSVSVSGTEMQVCERSRDEVTLLKVPEGIMEAKLCSIILAVDHFTTVALEHPERGMHPQMVERLRDLVLMEIKHKVVFITTHHPSFLAPWIVPCLFFFRHDETYGISDIIPGKRLMEKDDINTKTRRTNRETPEDVFSDAAYMFKDDTETFTNREKPDDVLLDMRFMFENDTEIEPDFISNELSQNQCNASVEPSVYTSEEGIRNNNEVLEDLYHEGTERNRNEETENSTVKCATQKDLQIFTSDQVSTMFFAKRVMLVEGRTDYNFMSVLIIVLIRTLHERNKPRYGDFIRTISKKEEETERERELENFLKFLSTIHILHMDGHGLKQRFNHLCETLKIERCFLLDKDVVTLSKITRCKELFKNQRERYKKAYLEKGTQTVMDGTQTEMDGTQTEMDGSQTEMDGTQTVMDGTQTVMDGTQTEMDGTQTEMDGTQTEMDGTQTEMDGTQTVMDGTQTEMDGTQTEMDGTQTEMDGTQTEMDGTQTVMDGTQTEMDGTQTEMDGTQTVMDGTQTEMDGTQTVIDDNDDNTDNSCTKDSNDSFCGEKPREADNEDDTGIFAWKYGTFEEFLIAFGKKHGELETCLRQNNFTIQKNKLLNKKITKSSLEAVITTILTIGMNEDVSEFNQAIQSLVKHLYNWARRVVSNNANTSTTIREKVMLVAGHLGPVFLSMLIEIISADNKYGRIIANISDTREVDKSNSVLKAIQIANKDEHTFTEMCKEHWKHVHDEHKIYLILLDYDTISSGKTCQSFLKQMNIDKKYSPNQVLRKLEELEEEKIFIWKDGALEDAFIYFINKHDSVKHGWQKEITQTCLIDGKACTGMKDCLFQNEVYFEKNGVGEIVKFKDSKLFENASFEQMKHMIKKVMYISLKEKEPESEFWRMLNFLFKMSTR